MESNLNLYWRLWGSPNGINFIHNIQKNLKSLFPISVSPNISRTRQLPRASSSLQSLQNVFQVPFMPALELLLFSFHSLSVFRSGHISSNSMVSPDLIFYSPQSRRWAGRQSLAESRGYKHYMFPYYTICFPIAPKSVKLLSFNLFFEKAWLIWISLFWRLPWWVIWPHAVFTRFSPQGPVDEMGLLSPSSLLGGSWKLNLESAQASPPHLQGAKWEIQLEEPSQAPPMAREIRACNADRITIHRDITTVCLVLLPLHDNILISRSIFRKV